ncbi:hypothetical protein OIV83_003083 [Microbotryomycetes sp. JL201]|nr:hypothetical protein OIV83_003083 [Microbotryomycetes sp. JL201]
MTLAPQHDSHAARNGFTSRSHFAKDQDQQALTQRQEPTVASERSSPEHSPPLRSNDATRLPSEPKHVQHPPPRQDQAVTAATMSLLVFATIWGVLARLGLEWIGSFGQSEVFPLVWAQIIGCLIMGLVVEKKKGIERMFSWHSQTMATQNWAGFTG